MIGWLDHFALEDLVATESFSSTPARVEWFLPEAEGNAATWLCQVPDLRSWWWWRLVHWTTMVHIRRYQKTSCPRKFTNRVSLHTWNIYEYLGMIGHHESHLWNRQAISIHQHLHRLWSSASLTWRMDATPPERRIEAVSVACWICLSEEVKDEARSHPNGGIWEVIVRTLLWRFYIKWC